MILQPTNEARLMVGEAPPLFISDLAYWETFGNHGIRLN
jgi:hypothetical protein